jgi:hypothetical protein
MSDPKKERTMKKSGFMEEQIIDILREQEAGSKTANVCRKHGISNARFLSGSPSMAAWMYPRPGR